MTTLNEDIGNFGGIETTAEQEAARDVHRRTLQIGIVAGLRSMMPLALLFWHKPNEEGVVQEEDPAAAQTAKYISALAALGELVGDKLPITPSRVRPGPLAARIALGAFSGAILSRRFNQDALSGAINGAVGAGIGAAIGYTARVLLDNTIKLPDAVWAVAEDALALRLGMDALKTDSASGEQTF